MSVWKGGGKLPKPGTGYHNGFLFMILSARGK